MPRTDMKRINMNRKSRMLHIEGPGFIVNIDSTLTDSQGRTVCHIDVSADGSRYAGNPEWWINGEKGNAGLGLCIIRTTDENDQSLSPEA